MKCFILIDLTKGEYDRNNVLFFEPLKEDAISEFSKSFNLETKDSVYTNIVSKVDKMIEAIGEEGYTIDYMIDYAENEQIKIILFDDTDICVPISPAIYLLSEDNIPNRFFGDYASYVIGVYAEDVYPKHKGDIESLVDYSSYHPEHSIKVKNADDVEVSVSLVRIDKKYLP